MSLPDEVAELSGRLDAIERSIARFERGQSQLEQAFKDVLAIAKPQHDAEGGEDDDYDPRRHAFKDEKVRCPKCGARLAFYDKGRDELRIRFQKHTVWIVPGIGGVTRIQCTGCSEVVELKDTRPLPKAARGS